MRIRRSVTRFFGALIIPVLCGACLCYFGGYAIWGDRGALALEKVQAKLDIQHEKLARLESDRQHLQKRIALMSPGSVDPDMVEELARGELLDGGPGQVAVSRTAH